MAASRAVDTPQILTVQEFSEILQSTFKDSLCGVSSVAVGLSGGPDSMALTRLLADVASANPGSPHIHALTVDHGLRVDSATEAEQVNQWVSGWPHVTHAILKWDGASTRIQEEARKARYALMADYCRGQGIKHLFLAHHQDDQAETVLFRLAKGSGLDGLGGIRPVQTYDDLMFLRPFLDVSKERILATCASMVIPFVKDPSNEAEKFARIRLRKSAEILGEEGLTSKRLAVTAKRLARASAALEMVTQGKLDDIVLDKDTKHVVLNYSGFKMLPEELGLRCLLKVIATLRPGEDYAPRLESVEDILRDMLASEAFRKRTLGGLVFERNDSKDQVIIFLEP